MKVAILKEDISAASRSTKVFDDKQPTLALIAEGLARRHEIYTFTPQTLILKGEEIFARYQKIEMVDIKKKFLKIGKETLGSLDKFNSILVRLDPPFDLEYFSAMMMLEKIKSKIPVINNPFWIRNFIEKLYPFDFSEFSPPTLITSDYKAVHTFRKNHGDIILKPLYGHGGDGILRIKEDDKNLISAMELMYKQYKAPAVIQKYIPEAVKGDKRLLIMDGKHYAAFTRIAAKYDNRSNIKAGGSLHKAILNKRDNEICEALIPELEKRGIVVCGVDVIGGFVTEINVTAPTGFEDLRKFHGIDGEGLFWKAVEKRI